jgi:tRNA (guanine37-N1)-methyltransferase
MVAPDLQGRGLGRLLLGAIEQAAPAAATSYELFTGAGSRRNQKMYKKAGYRDAGRRAPGVVRMTKRRPTP